MKLARYSLYFFALGFLTFGGLLLFAPTALTTLTEIALPTPVALMEVRGVYGGFFIGTALFLLLCARRESWLQPGLVALAVIMGGLLVGCTLGFILHGAGNPLIYLLYISEAAGLMIALAALRSLSQSPA
jgi:peptidoglycan/LPS O-acetylase OafA/YrhL